MSRVVCSVNEKFSFKEKPRSLFVLLLTAREGNVFTGVCYSVDNWPHGYSVTVHPSYGAVCRNPTGILSCS